MHTVHMTFQRLGGDMCTRAESGRPHTDLLVTLWGISVIDVLHFLGFSFVCLSLFVFVYFEAEFTL